MKIQIKQLGAENLAAANDLSHILIYAWQFGFRGILPDSIIEKYTRFEPCTDMFRHILMSGIGTMYLALMDSQSVGLLYWLPEGQAARIEALLTVPDVWGKGVATALMKRAFEDTSSYQKIAVWPFAQNHRARRFYEKHGFLPTGNTRMGDAEEVEYIRFHL